MSSKAQWTILTYIAAHNNLETMGRQSRDQILSVGSTPDVKHGILFDAPTETVRYLVGDAGQFSQQDQLANFDSGDADGLLETATWVFQRLPAERYGLILWSHGSGWEPYEIQAVANTIHHDAPVDGKEAIERSAGSGSYALFRQTLAQMLKPVKRSERAVLFDDGTGHSLDTLELARVADEIQKVIGQPLEILGMDACLMASLEVAYQLRKHVSYLVASEELVPGLSWPYDEVFGALRAAPNMTGADLAATTVRKYTDYHAIFPQGQVTQVALDLSTVDKLATAVGELAQALTDAMDSQAALLWEAQLQTEKKESRNYLLKPTKFDFHLWDVATLAAVLADYPTKKTGSLRPTPAVRAAAAGVRQALAPGGPTVLAEGHFGDWFAGIGGVTVYLMPPGEKRISPYYKDVALAKDTGWLKMLEAYHAASAS